jgi:hypothetical protein
MVGARKLFTPSLIRREEVFADCGHTPHIEMPDAFRRVLIEFLP